MTLGRRPFLARSMRDASRKPFVEGKYKRKNIYKKKIVRKYK